MIFMAKKKSKRTPQTRKDTEETFNWDDTEYKNMKKIFIGLFICSILFLAVYLIGLINILLNRIL